MALVLCEGQEEEEERTETEDILGREGMFVIRVKERTTGLDARGDMSDDLIRGVFDETASIAGLVVARKKVGGERN